MKFVAFQSPSLWVKVFSVGAALGTGCLFVGAKSANRALIALGMVLGAPLLLGALGIVLALPWAIWVRMKEKRSVQSPPNK